MVGAFKPKMLRLTARYADWWNVSGFPTLTTLKLLINEVLPALNDGGR